MYMNLAISLSIYIYMWRDISGVMLVLDASWTRKQQINHHVESCEVFWSTAAHLVQRATMCLGHDSSWCWYLGRECSQIRYQNAPQHW